MTTFDHGYADCANCALSRSCSNRYVTAYQGPKYKRPGGLMIVTGPPSLIDVSKGQPLVDSARSRVFDAVLQAVGIDRESCWITSAVLGSPPRTSGKALSFHRRCPDALYACLPRLEEEIAYARPRVIVTLGVAALTAITGRVVTTTKQTPFDCPGGSCNDKRKIGPALKCATGDCDWHVMMPKELADDAVWAWRAQIIEQHDKKCPKCEAKINRLRPRMMKCPACGGRKTRAVVTQNLEAEYVLRGREGAAGAVFDTSELDSRLDKLGVRYVIPTYAPGLFNRDPKPSERFIAGQFAANAAAYHLKKAQELLSRDAEFNYRVLQTQQPDVARAWFARHRGQRIACDIETNSEGGPWKVSQITCIGFATADDPEALVIDTRHIGHYSTLGHKASTLLDVIDAFLDDPGQQKVFHNGAYDRVVIMNLWGIWVNGVVGDTMLAHNACFPDEEHNLAFVAHELTDAPMWKDDRTSIGQGLTHEYSGYSCVDSLAEYNAKDDRLTALCDAVFEGGLLAAEGQPAAYASDVALQEIAIAMELHGIPVSSSRLAEIEHEYEQLVAVELAAMRVIAKNDTFVPTGAALLWALYDPAGVCMLPVTVTTSTGLGSTRKEHLQKLAPNVPFIQHLLRWKKYTKQISTYIRSDALAPAYDGRVHPQWKVIGARTGRWSSAPNFQNWPKFMRGAVVAPPGRKLVGADYAQLEMRIMAALSADAELIRRCAEADESDKLNPDKDPHAYVAHMTFGNDYLTRLRAADGHKQCKQLRDLAKRVVYGLNYGAGERTVLESVFAGGYEGRLDIGTVRAVKEAYFRAFPGVLQWRQAQVTHAVADGAVRSPVLGRHRVFPLSRVETTVAYNYPIQSGAADIMNQRLLVLADALPQVDPSAMLIAQVHDAIYVECDEAAADAVARCVEESLAVELSLSPGGAAMPFVAWAAIGDTWKDV